jgi:hypothetical protein
MKTILPSVLLAVFTAAALAADKYQVTGPVVEVTDKIIVIEKGAKKERFEIMRNADTKVTGDLKVGAKVTVQYTMTATAVEVK